MPFLAPNVDGDGLELIGLEDSYAFFDMDEDGFAENTGWVSADDGILAWDMDGDGLISQTREIVFALYGGEGATDIDGLREGFDRNEDGLLDDNDENFAKFGIWQDKDGDGKHDEGEFTSLANMGILSIGLDPDRLVEDIEGNQILGMSGYTRNGLSICYVYDVSFKDSDVGLDYSGGSFTKILENGEKAVFARANSYFNILNLASKGAAIG